MENKIPERTNHLYTSIPLRGNYNNKEIAKLSFSKKIFRRFKSWDNTRCILANFCLAVIIPPLDNGEQPFRIVLDGNQDHSSRNRSSTYSNARRCWLSRFVNDKKCASTGWRTYSNALACWLSRLINDKKRPSEHRRTYSNTLRYRSSRLINDKKRVSSGRRTYSNALWCRLSRLAMIKNNVIGHRRTYSNALRCGLSRLAMIKNSRRQAGVPTQTHLDVDWVGLSISHESRFPLHNQNQSVCDRLHQ